MNTSNTSTWLEKAQAQDLGDSNTPAWKPEQDGDACAGRVVSIKTGAGRDGSSTFVDLIDEGGEPFGLWLNSILQHEFEKQNVNRGDVIGVRFHGWRQSKAGRDYKAFSLQIIERAHEGDMWPELQDNAN